jgi:hypothetical protein
MSWLFSQALVEEYLVDTSSDGKQSALLNGNPTQQAYCAPDKMTAFSRLSRFGMTYKPLTVSCGEELLTLYREGFRAKISQPQGGGLELTENAAGCGEKWRASFTKYNPDSHSWKTHQYSLLEDLEPFLETWPQWGLMRNGECWEQQTLAQITKGTESGLLPTPTMQGLNGGSNSRKSSIAKGTWPTPRSCSAMAATISPEAAWNEKRKANLETIVGQRMWPSPKTRDWKDGKTEGTSNRQSPDLGKVVGQSKTTGSLNPTWVEWLMGWPLGWTDLKPLATDKFHSVQQQPGSFSVNNGEICL